MTPVTAPVVANVWKVLVDVGDVVEAGATVAILESMKMEIPVTAPVGGTVVEVCVAPDEIVQEGAPVVQIG
jgi:biotin carboxyl carrier protein